MRGSFKNILIFQISIQAYVMMVERQECSFTVNMAYITVRAD